MNSSKYKIYEKKTSLMYFYCFFMIHVSGNRFFSQNKALLDVVVLVIAFLVCFFARENSLKIRKNDLLFFVIATVFFMFSMMFGSNESFSSYIHFMVCLLSAYFFAKTFSIQTFSGFYVKTMLFLSIASLVFFTVGLIYPQFFNIFQNIPYSTLSFGTSSQVSFVNRVYVNALFLYTYISPYGYGTSSAWSYTRNNGIFWEPGAYQFFLMLAIILLNEYCAELSEKTKFKMNVFLFITLLTTQSTTGIIVCLILLVTYRKKLMIKKMKKSSFYILLGILVAASIFVIQYISVWDFLALTYTKIFGTDYYSNSSGSNLFSRFGLQAVAALFDSVDNLLFGVGVNGAQELNFAFPNTYLYLCVSVGIPYAIIFMSKLFFKFKLYFKEYVLAFLCLVLSFSTEQWIFYIIPLSLLFFEKEKSKSRNVVL